MTLLTDEHSIDLARRYRDKFLHTYRYQLPNLPAEHLAKLLKLPNRCGSILEGSTYKTSTGITFHKGITEEAFRTLEALAGPHGWAIYKTLLVRFEQPVV